MAEQPSICPVDGCTLELEKDIMPGATSRAFGGKVHRKPDRVSYYCPKHGVVK
jgi:hypothetical protein